MAAVVRVKRKINEPPLSAFVLNGVKRRREMAENAATSETEITDLANLALQKDEISTVMKFAGTINEQDNNATTRFARLTKEAAKELVKQKTRKPTNVTEKSRQEMRASLHESRFRVVNCMRTTLDDDTSDDEDDQAVAAAMPVSSNVTKPNTEITIIDIEKENDSNGNAATETAPSITEHSAAIADIPQQQQQPIPAAHEPSVGYVYDLYLADDQQQATNNDVIYDHYLRVRPFDDLIYEDCYLSDENDDCYSEDSNREDNIANDYPDEENEYEMNSDNESENTYNMRHAIQNFMFDDDDDDDEQEHEEYADGSSGDEDYITFQDPYIHSADVSDEQFVDDLDYVDIDRYGTAYAQYKARRLKATQKKNSSENFTDDDSDDDGDGGNNDDCDS